MKLNRYNLAVFAVLFALGAAAQAQPTPAAAAAPEQPAAEAPAANGAAASPENRGALPPTVDPSGAKVYSYGLANYSVFFTPKQVERMKAAIKAYEDIPRESASTTFVAPVEVETKPEVKIEEPASYPVFYLASIAYDQPNDWSIWVSGHKITSRRNETDVKVVSVSHDSVTFQWKPAYGAAIIQRRNAHAFANTDPVKNKLADVQNASFDDATGTLTFTLRQNQSFAVGYFNVFEGYVATPKLEALMGAASASASGMSKEEMQKRMRERMEQEARMKASGTGNVGVRR